MISFDPRTSDEPQSIYGETKRLTRHEVGAQVLQNFFGGGGVAIAIGAAQALAGVSALQHWQWPVYIGALAFGVSMAIRMHLDEYKGWSNLRALKATHRYEMQKLTALADKLEKRSFALQTEYDALLANYNRTVNELETARYRSITANTTGRHTPLQDTYSDTARADARALLKEWYRTGAWPGIRTMGWTRARHTTARDLLISARVMAAPPTNASVPPATEAWAIDKLEGWLGNAVSAASV